MHLRRLASFLLGVWLAGTIVVAVIAIENTSSADRILRAPAPEVRKLVLATSSERVHLLLRHQGWEQNRLFLSAWGFAQLAIGAALAGLFLLSKRVNRIAVWVCGAMVVLGGFGQFVILPELTYIGRALDFVQGWSGDRARYYVLQLVFGGIEALKFALASGLALYLFVYHTRRGFRQGDRTDKGASGEATATAGGGSMPAEIGADRQLPEKRYGGYE